MLIKCGKNMTRSIQHITKTTFRVSMVERKALKELRCRGRGMKRCECAIQD